MMAYEKAVTLTSREDDRGDQLTAYAITKGDRQVRTR